MQGYGWPGNVRELRNVVERAVYQLDGASQSIERLQFDPFASPYRPIAATGPDKGQDLAKTDAPLQTAPAPAAPELPVDFPQQVAVFETRLIEAALQDARFNQKEAAGKLGLTYHQFRGLLRKYKLLNAGRATSS
jgi:psp operon transcriptional activator